MAKKSVIKPTSSIASTVAGPLFNSPNYKNLANNIITTQPIYTYISNSMYNNVGGPGSSGSFGTSGTNHTTAKTLTPDLRLKLAKIEQKVKSLRLGVDRLLAQYVYPQRPVNVDTGRDNAIHDLNTAITEIMAIVDSCYVVGEYNLIDVSTVQKHMKMANKNWAILKKLGVSHSTNWFK